MQMILGGIYAWSTLTGYLHDEFGITNGESAFIFGSTIFLFTMVMVYSGRVLSQRGPRFTAVIGLLLFAGGYRAASFSQGLFPLLFVSISLLSGAGIGFGYVVPLSVALAWFPANPGLVTGLAVGGFGGGAILLSAIIEAWHMQAQLPYPGFSEPTVLFPACCWCFCPSCFPYPAKGTRSECWSRKPFKEAR